GGAYRRFGRLTSLYDRLSCGDKNFPQSGDKPMTSHVSLSRSVSGLVVLVTGAASGMGRATAQVFAQEGAKVIVTDVNAEHAEAVAHGIREQGGQARAWALDVSDGQAIKQVVDAAAKHFGGLDAVVNNAGISV